MKRTLILITALALVLALTACGGGSGGGSSDKAYVQEKGTLVVGITDFAPMDYKDEDGQWIGFDADMAKAFAESLGVEAEFIEIDWANKVPELENRSVDVVWNGMTLNAEALEAMACSNPYCENAQTVIVPVEKAGDYATAEDLAGLVFAVEDGSAGEEQAVALGCEYTEVLTQADALLEVRSGTSDAAIIDLQMANAMVGGDTDYADLAAVMDLNSEQYGVGFRKGSDLCPALNDFFLASYEDGTMQQIADAYGIAVIDQTAAAGK